MRIDRDIRRAFRELQKTLLDKNRMYGNSVHAPVGIFSKLGPVEALRVQIDHKLSRVRSQQPDDTEDSVDDLIGYLVHLKIATKRTKKR